MKDVYMDVQEGVNGVDRKCITFKLIKSQYGLEQEPRMECQDWLIPETLGAHQ